MFSVFATKAAEFPVPINKTFFFASNPAFSSTNFTATSPRDTISFAIPVVSLILEDNLITLSNNLLRIVPDVPADFACDKDWTISSNTSCFPTTNESIPEPKRKRLR